MVYTVRGLKKSSGEYQGFGYDNIRMHCLCPDDGKMLAGEPVEIITVKKVIFNTVCNRNKMGMDDLIGCQIRVFYDKFGKAEDFDVVAFPDR